MDILNLKLTEIKPYEKNPRINDEAAEYVAESIKNFGFKVPIVIDKNYTIVCGHTRYKAAKKLKLETVPCILADDLTEEQVKAFRLADNKVTEYSEWDFEKLFEEVQDIDEELSKDFDFDNINFDDVVFSEEFNAKMVDPEIFSLTLTFSKENEEDIKGYVKKEGKENIVNYLINEIKKEGDDDK